MTLTQVRSRHRRLAARRSNRFLSRLQDKRARYDDFGLVNRAQVRPIHHKPNALSLERLRVRATRFVTHHFFFLFRTRRMAHARRLSLDHGLSTRETDTFRMLGLFHNHTARFIMVNFFPDRIQLISRLAFQETIVDEDQEILNPTRLHHANGGFLDLFGLDFGLDHVLDGRHILLWWLLAG